VAIRGLFERPFPPGENYRCSCASADILPLFAGRLLVLADGLFLDGQFRQVRVNRRERFVSNVVWIVLLNAFETHGPCHVYLIPAREAGQVLFNNRPGGGIIEERADIRVCGRIVSRWSLRERCGRCQSREAKCYSNDDSTRDFKDAHDNEPPLIHRLGNEPVLRLTGDTTVMYIGVD
jgi:hypothetical protein